MSRWEGAAVFNFEPNKGLRLTTSLSFAPDRHGYLLPRWGWGCLGLLEGSKKIGGDSRSILLASELDYKRKGAGKVPRGVVVVGKVPRGGGRIPT